MPRAKIPYEEIEQELNNTYPWPVFRSVRVVRKDQYQGMTPIRVYDRTTGNFKPIGWKVTVEYSRFQGSYYDNMQPQYQEERFLTVVIMSD